MAMFSALDSAAGLEKLNAYLSTKSYIKGYNATLADTAVLDAIRGRPDGSKFPHVLRWYKTVTALSDHALEILDGSAEGIVDATPTAAVAEKKDAGDDDDFDPFGSDDEEDEEAYRAQQKRADEALKAKEKRDAEKAAKGKVVIAKSSVVFDVKPWDDTTDMKAMEVAVRKITIDGLHWGASKLQPIGYGISKLQIMATIIDDKVPSTEVVEEQITEIEDYVQSVDIASFNKL